MFSTIAACEYVGMGFFDECDSTKCRKKLVARLTDKRVIDTSKMDVVDVPASMYTGASIEVSENKSISADMDDDKEVIESSDDIALSDNTITSDEAELDIDNMITEDSEQTYSTDFLADNIAPVTDEQQLDNLAIAAPSISKRIEKNQSHTIDNAALADMIGGMETDIDDFIV